MPAPDRHRLVDTLWYGRGAVATVARTLLLPLSGLYAGITGVRNVAYARGMLRSHGLSLPAISVGNLSVGGTGKTPVAAWLAAGLLQRGYTPAVVLRGYGDDEPAVHARLNPNAVVVANPDRVAGVAEAAARGADVAVLDDAFQHRRARRDADIVLISADRWPDQVRRLPRGPFREPLSALRRASLVVITRKAATVPAAMAVERAVRSAAPGIPVARVHLRPDLLVDVRTGERRPLASLVGRGVLAVCGVGDPGAFRSQLAAVGAAVTLRAFPDHHPYDDADVASLATAARRLAGQGGVVVCTLKDAVKLGDRWPGDGAALSYVSQHVILEAGQEALDRLLASVLHSRRPGASATG